MSFQSSLTRFLRTFQCCSEISLLFNFQRSIPPQVLRQFSALNLTAYLLYNILRKLSSLFLKVFSIFSLFILMLLFNEFGTDVLCIFTKEV